ncbi:hypothetical protein 2L372D_215 [Aeromonas phage 2L372D]|uniref:Uncharacterized protein n=1 Tax=Aeromonas phage 2L372D TaxID=2588097 RepID=A0A4Y5TYM6_9CAUD|nr:hypothetical protein HWC25_gp215 [Aeromonas phage 2L372D]QDB74129.1 hypothetical protein 2L372D_215 [Aeromonas phage 2L372D]WBF79551.1 hypothetical protein BNCALIDO_00162 [Aeromonas phage vB_AdhM_TS9]
MDMYSGTPTIIVGMFCIILTIVFGLGCLAGWLLF